MIGKCKFCQFEKESKCSKKKNATVKLNKRRPCNMFVVDEQKAEDFLARRNTPECTLRPDWFWDKNAKKAAIKAAVDEEMSQYKTTAQPDANHPLTGDLGKFTSTVEE